MDAKQACDKLNGYNFQNRYLVGMWFFFVGHYWYTQLTAGPVLYHQPDKMLRTKEDLDVRKENIERLKQQHGID